MKQGAKCRKRDGQSSTPISDSTTAREKSMGVKIFTFSIGSNASLIKNNLRDLSDQTSGVCYDINDYGHFCSDYADLVDIYYDTDSDGIPDDFELNLPLYNGNTIQTNPSISDTDGDGLSDGEEVQIVYRYYKGYSMVRVYTVFKSDPLETDSDGDGISDVLDSRPLKNDIKRIGLSHDYVSVVGHPGTPSIDHQVTTSYEPSYGGNQNWFSYIDFQTNNTSLHVNEYNNLASRSCTLIAAADFLLYVVKNHPELDLYNDYSNTMGNINSIDFYSYMDKVMYLERNFFDMVDLQSDEGLDSKQIQFILNRVFDNYDIKLRCNVDFFEFFNVNTLIHNLNKDLPVYFTIRRNTNKNSITFYTPEVIGTNIRNSIRNKICNENHTVNLTGVVYDGDTTWLEISSWGEKYYIDLSEFQEKCLQLNCILHFRSEALY